MMNRFQRKELDMSRHLLEANLEYRIKPCISTLAKRMNLVMGTKEAESKGKHSHLSISNFWGAH